MAVEKNRSAEMVIKVLESVAEHQPVGVGDLSRIMGETKSSLQRALVTLAGCKWIRMAPGKPTRWELSERIHTIAWLGQSHSDLRNRARPLIEALRQDSGETVVLEVPEDGRMVIVEAFESRQKVRTSAAVGMVVPIEVSASGIAILAWLDEAGQAALLGHAPDEALSGELAETRKRGWSLDQGGQIAGLTNIGAAVFEGGQPVAAVVLGAPSERLPKSRYRETAEMVARTARLLSRGAIPR
jgi:IclR family acetate operon transcriptional repressor